MILLQLLEFWLLKEDDCLKNSNAVNSQSK